MLRLYSYFRSSCSYRVRIALHLKGVDFDYVPIHLLEGGGQQNSEAYLARNPIGELPTLEVLNAGGEVVATLSQSVAILEYLEETYREPALLPEEPGERAKVRQLVEVVNSSIQPIQNLRVMQRLRSQFELDRPATLEWSKHWIERGFVGLEKILKGTAGVHAFGDQLSLADVVIVPQEYNARRFGVEMSNFPTIQRICATANQLTAFVKAAPDQQPDTPADL